MNVDNRKFPRHIVPSVRVVVNGSQSWAVSNISATGVLAHGSCDTLKAGNTCRFRILVPVFGRKIAVPLKGTVVRQGDGRVALEYQKPSRIWERLLSVLASESEASVSATA